MTPDLVTPAILVSGLGLLAFLLKWLFGRAERTLDAIAQRISDLVASVGAQATRVAVLEAKVEVLEGEVEKLRSQLRRGVA